MLVPIHAISTVLGDSKHVTRSYPDGSVDCPYCSNAIHYPAFQCRNPYCDANPQWKPDALREHREKRAADKAQRDYDNESRRQGAEFARACIAEHVAWESAQIDEANRRGACVLCLFQPGWERVRFVVHRAGCPKRRRA